MTAGDAAARVTAEDGAIDAPLFTVGGVSFACVDHVPHWNTMRLAAAMDSGDDMKALAAMYRFVLGMVRPEEHERLDAHLSTIDFERSELDHAIGDAMVDMARRGKGTGVPTSTRLTEPGSGPSSAGSPETKPMRRVVSLSRGTVEAHEGAPTSSTP